MRWEEGRMEGRMMRTEDFLGYGVWIWVESWRERERNWEGFFS